MKTILSLIPGPIKALIGTIAFLITLGWGAVMTQKSLATAEAVAATAPIIERVNGLEKRQEDSSKALTDQLKSMDEKLNILIQRK